MNDHPPLEPVWFHTIMRLFVFCQVFGINLHHMYGFYISRSVFIVFLAIQMYINSINTTLL